MNFLDWTKKYSVAISFLFGVVRKLFYLRSL